jgi:hypothetical protein
VAAVTGYVDAIVVSSGEPSTLECLERLSLQTHPDLTIRHIQDVAPTGAAFQRMLDMAQGRLFIQVDADMLLEPGAVAHLVAAIDKHPPEVVMHAGWLWGDTEDRPVGSVKVYRTEMAKQIRFRPVPFCDKDWNIRASAAGMVIKADPAPQTREACLGLHFTEQSPERTYLHWFKLANRLVLFPKNQQWVLEHFPRLRARAVREDTPFAWAAFLGAVAGLTSSVNTPEDYRIPPIGWERMVMVRLCG